MVAVGGRGVDPVAGVGAGLGLRRTADRGPRERPRDRGDEQDEHGEATGFPHAGAASAAAAARRGPRRPRSAERPAATGRAAQPGRRSTVIASPKPSSAVAAVAEGPRRRARPRGRARARARRTARPSSARATRPARREPAVAPVGVVDRRDPAGAQHARDLGEVARLVAGRDVDEHVEGPDGVHARVGDARRAPSRRSGRTRRSPASRSRSATRSSGRWATSTSTRRSERGASRTLQRPPPGPISTTVPPGGMVGRRTSSTSACFQSSEAVHSSPIRDQSQRFQRCRFSSAELSRHARCAGP